MSNDLSAPETRALRPGPRARFLAFTRGPRDRFLAFARGPRGRRTLLALAGVVVLGLLVVLRQTAPPADRTEPGAAPSPTVVTPSPTTPPKGDLPTPDVIDRDANRIVGNLPKADRGPGQFSLLSGVYEILNWYCPESTLRQVSIQQLDAWKTVEITARPRPGTELVLILRWTGDAYRWQGPLDQLEECW